MNRLFTAESPLVGREVELDRIASALSGSSPAAFVLAGTAGVGKTRLAAEAAKVAGGLGFATENATATRAAASIPFGPFAPLLPMSEVAPGDRLGLLRQVSEAIVERAGPDRRLLLVVDDVHLLDDGSAALVYQLVHKGSCSVLATMRTPSSAPDPVTAVWKDGLAERIDLNPLSEAEVEKTVAGVLGGPVARGSVRRLWEVSGGNALYLRELVIGAAASGALSETGGMWSLHLPLTAPDRLVELVKSRLANLGPATAEVIELLAAGEPLGLTLLEDIAGAAAVEDAEVQGFVEVYQDGRRTDVRLSHPIYGEAVRQTLPRSRLRRISALLAATIQARGAHRREDLLRLARWQLDTGGSGDPEMLSRAARRASEMFDLDLASRLAALALDSGGGVEAGLVLGEAKFRSGQHEEAESVLASLVEMCANDTDLARVANARSNNFSNLMGNAGAAAAVLAEALAVITDDKERLRLLGRLATNRMFEGDPTGALQAAEQLLASSDEETLARGCYVSSIASALLGRGDDAVSLAYRGLDARRRASQITQLPEAQLIGAVLGHRAFGRFAQAESLAATGSEACLSSGDKEGLASFSVLRGCLLIDRGQLREASRFFLEAATINREIRDIAALRWCVGGQALALGMSGRAALSAAAVTELDGLPGSWMTFFEPDLVERGRAWASIALGEISAGCAKLRQAASLAVASHQPVAEAWLLHDLARLGEASSVAPRLAELAEAVDGDVVLSLSRHCDAAARGSAQGLETSGLAFEALGASLLAAEAHMAAAAYYRSEGSARRASASTRRAEDLAAVCGDVRTPGLSVSESTVQLSRREREVANLAATGLSSREISAKLFLSVRTVDTHLQHVYSKLGVTSRAELTKALRLPGD